MSKQAVLRLADKYGVVLTPRGIPYMIRAVNTELEHRDTIESMTGNHDKDYLLEFAFRIALDHIREVEDYYDKLISAKL